MRLIIYILVLLEFPIILIFFSVLSFPRVYRPRKDTFSGEHGTIRVQALCQVKDKGNFRKIPIETGFPIFTKIKKSKKVQIPGSTVDLEYFQTPSWKALSGNTLEFPIMKP